MAINDPQKLFAHELGMALGAEKKILTMLKKLEREAQQEQLKQQFRHHRDETEGQIRNLEQAFSALGEKPTGRHHESVVGLADETDKMLEKVDEQFVDSVLLGGAAKTEHLEIAMYRGLITKAEAMGADDVVALLQENLEQEEHTAQEVERAARELSTRIAQTV
jgi:ferritin-like metal-binding protein YciE